MSTVKIRLEGDKELKKMLKRCKNPEKIKACVKNAGSTMQQTAQRNAPVDTGTLRRSITLTITNGGMQAEVQPTVHYGAYVELGTRFMNARPYLKPALDKAQAEFKSLVEAAVMTEIGGG
jgi:HK97 gp10 family phage protein